MAETLTVIPDLVVKQSYPRSISTGAGAVTLRQMRSDDRDAMVDFALRLPEEDLLFLRMDITQPQVVDSWIESIESGRRFTVVAEAKGALAGYGSLNRQSFNWSRHLGEIRMIVDPEHRGTGLGGILANEVFSVARDSGLTKIVAQMARQQGGARKVFSKLGFSVESMLADWVIDREGRTHDLVIMSYDVTGFTSTA